MGPCHVQHHPPGVAGTPSFRFDQEHYRARHPTLSYSPSEKAVLFAPGVTAVNDEFVTAAFQYFGGVTKAQVAKLAHGRVPNIVVTLEEIAR